MPISGQVSTVRVPAYAGNIALSSGRWQGSAALACSVALGSFVSNGGANIQSTSVTPPTGGPVALIGCANIRSGTYSPGSGFTTITTSNLSYTAGSTAVVVEGGFVNSPSGSYTINATGSGTYTWAGLAFKCGAALPIQATSGTWQNPNVATLTLGVPPTPGNILIWVSATNTRGTSPSVRQPTVGTWTVVFQYTGGVTEDLIVYAHCVQQGDPQSWQPVAQGDDRSLALMEYAQATQSVVSSTSTNITYAQHWNDLTGVTLSADGTTLNFGTGSDGVYHVAAWAGFTAASVPSSVALVPTNADPGDTVAELDTRASSGNTNLLQTGDAVGTHAFYAGDKLQVAVTQYSGSPQTVGGASLNLVKLGPPPPSGSRSCSLAIGTPYTATNIWHEATTASGSIQTGTAGITFAWLCDTNGNTPGATNMTTFGSYWTQVANMPQSSKTTWNLAYTNLTGYLSASATYTPGYANDGAGAALMVNLRSKATSIVQWIQAAAQTQWTFSNPVTPGNIILMFCLAEPFPYGYIVPIGTGWTLLASENNYMWGLGSTAGDAIYNIYARCVNTGDGQTYGFNKSSGYSTGCGIILVEITP